MTALAFSPDGSMDGGVGVSRVAFAGGDGSRRRRLPGMSERIHSLAFSKDGTLLVAAGGTPARFGEVQFWDARRGKCSLGDADRRHRVWRVAGAGWVAVAVGCADNTVRILEPRQARNCTRSAITRTGCSALCMARTASGSSRSAAIVRRS